MAAMQRAVGCLGGIVGVAGLFVVAVALQVWAQALEDEGVEGSASNEEVGVQDE